MYAVKTPSKYMTAKTRRGELILLFQIPRRLPIYNTKYFVNMIFIIK